MVNAIIRQDPKNKQDIATFITFSTIKDVDSLNSVNQENPSPDSINFLNKYDAVVYICQGAESTEIIKKAHPVIREHFAMKFTPRILFNLQKDQNQVVDSLELANEVETRVICDLDIG